MIGIVLLSIDNYYIGKEGQLPDRPSFDKDFLLSLVTNNICIASKNTYKDLPKSIFNRAKEVIVYSDQLAITATVNLGIKTFKVFPPELFFVVKSDKPLNEGKKFDMDWLNNNYNLIYETKNLNIFIIKK